MQRHSTGYHLLCTEKEKALTNSFWNLSPEHTVFGGRSFTTLTPHRDHVSQQFIKTGQTEGSQLSGSFRLSSCHSRICEISPSCSASIISTHDFQGCCVTNSFFILLDQHNRPQAANLSQWIFCTLQKRSPFLSSSSLPMVKCWRAWTC